MLRLRSLFILIFSFVLVSCGKAENDEKKISPSTLRFATWNIAHFNLGSGVENRITTESDYKRYLPIFRDIIKTVDADFFNVCEYESPFYAGHLETETKNELFPDYDYYKDNAPSYGAYSIAFFSRCQIYNVEEVEFSSHPEGKHRYYLVGTMVLGGKEVRVVCTHLTHATPNVYAPEQMRQLIEDFDNVQNVIILGDWNSGPVDFQPLIYAGYKLANYYPDFRQTYYSTDYYEGKMDNIAVKGGNIISSYVFNTNNYANSILSDHYLVYCDVLF